MASLAARKVIRLPVIPRKASANADDNIHVMAYTRQ